MGASLSILLINQYAGGPGLGMEYRPHWMARNWIAAGHDVTVVAGSFSHLRQSNPTVDSAVVEQVVDGVPYMFLRTNAYRGNGGRRVASMLGFSRALSSRLPRRLRRAPDVVIASSTHPFDVRPAHRLAKTCGASFVYEVHDVWPLTPMLLGGHGPGHPLMRWMQREEDYAYENADLVVSLLPGTLPHMIRHGLSADAWTYVPNGVDTSQPSYPVDREVAAGIASLRTRYPFVLAYAGGLGLSNALETVMCHADELSHEGIGIAIAGSGPRRDELVTTASRHDNVAFVGSLPHGQVRSFLSSADAAYVGVHPSPLYEFGTSLNKLYDYMYAGVPVLFCGSVAHNEVEATQCGLVALDASQLVRTAVQLASMPLTERTAMGSHGREHVVRSRDQAVLARGLADRLQQLVGSRRVRVGSSA